MDNRTALENSKRYALKVKESFPNSRVLLYGSYSNGEPTEHSDIDIAVIMNNFSGNWLKLSAQLWRYTENIDTRIEPILLDETNDKSGFCEYIMQTGIEL